MSPTILKAAQFGDVALHTGCGGEVVRADGTNRCLKCGAESTDIEMTAHASGFMPRRLRRTT